LDECWLDCIGVKRTIEDKQSKLASRFRWVDDHGRKIADSIAVEVAACGIRMIVRNRAPNASVACPHLQNVFRTITISVRGGAEMWMS